jgi:hypothetical protein
MFFFCACRMGAMSYANKASFNGTMEKSKLASRRIIVITPSRRNGSKDEIKNANQGQAPAQQTPLGRLRGDCYTACRLLSHHGRVIK